MNYRVYVRFDDPVLPFNVLTFIRRFQNEGERDAWISVILEEYPVQELQVIPIYA